MRTLSETAQLVLGAFAMADSHTLSAATIADMARGAISEAAAAAALEELREAGHAELLPAPPDQYRLTRRGLEITLQLQLALGSKAPPPDSTS